MGHHHMIRSKQMYDISLDSSDFLRWPVFRCIALSIRSWLWEHCFRKVWDNLVAFFFGGNVCFKYLYKNSHFYHKHIVKYLWMFLMKTTAFYCGSKNYIEDKRIGMLTFKFNCFLTVKILWDVWRSQTVGIIFSTVCSCCRSVHQKKITFFNL